MKLIKLSVFVFAVLFAACSSEKGSEELFNEVRGFHDEVMPYMSSLYQSEKKVKGMIADLDSTAVAEKQELEGKLESLVGAQESMSQWMREFKQVYNEEMPEAEKVKVLEEQLVKVKAMHVEFKAAIKISEEL